MINTFAVVKEDDERAVQDDRGEAAGAAVAVSATTTRMRKAKMIGKVRLSYEKDSSGSFVNIKDEDDEEAVMMI